VGLYCSVGGWASEQGSCMVPLIWYARFGKRLTCEGVPDGCCACPYCGARDRDTDGRSWMVLAVL